MHSGPQLGSGILAENGRHLAVIKGFWVKGLWVMCGMERASWPRANSIGDVQAIGT
jgi:hypothetical protein